MNAYQPRETQTYGYDNTCLSFDHTGTLIFGYDAPANWNSPPVHSNTMTLRCEKHRYDELLRTSGQSIFRPPLFTGKERDSESGLDYFGARYYGSALGRFTSPDPENISGLGHMQDPQSWNGYSYVRNNPLRYTDPTGLDWTVCESNGSNCGTVTDDAAFDKFDKDTGNYVQGGNYYDSNGNQIGTASWSAPNTDLAGAAMIGRTSVVANDIAVGFGAMSIGLGGGIAYGAIAGGEAITTMGLELLPSQARNIQTIDTIIADHVTLSDLAGGAKETAGFEIRTGTKVWDHVQELKDASRGLARAVKNLECSLKDPSHGAATRSVVQEAIQKGQTAMRMIDAALRR